MQPSEGGGRHSSGPLPTAMTGNAPQRRRWQSLRDAAAAQLAQETGNRQETGRALLADVGLAVLRRRAGTPERRRRTGASKRRRRTDLRLVPAALLVWGTALTGGWLEPVAIAALCAGLATAAVLLLMPRCRHTRPGGRRAAAQGAGSRVTGNLMTGKPIAGNRVAGGSGGRSGARSFRATLATALVLSAAAGAHAAVASAQRHDGVLAHAVTNRASVVAEIEVQEQPRRLTVPGRPGAADRWAFPATLRMLVFDGRRVEARAAILVLGGADWAGASAGQQFRTTGRLKPAAAGEAEAGMLSVTSGPTRLPAQEGQEPSDGTGPDTGSRPALGKLRGGFAAAAAELPGDARGLLPGMVTGDTTALDPDLATAMKTVGMTHLTAVSGANCSLVLGALLLAARTLRLPRPAAAALALAGLGLFVLLVGPEPSVLRAAGMGAIGLSALVAGRPGRGLSLLCVITVGLLLAQPDLAADFGFVLSVLATLGIIVSGRQIMDWLPGVVPRAVAAAVAVPLSAQLFCGPVIVLLQPQFSSYALAANLAAAALVAPVTLLGTAAVPLLLWAPAPAAALMAAAGFCASGVAGIARSFAALPGAALPWPGGAFGAATMALLSVLTLAAVWLAAHPAAARERVLTLHDRAACRLELLLDRDGRRPHRGLVPGRAGPRGLVDRSRRGRLRVCKPTSRRNHQWLLPQPNAPGPRRRTPPPGATSRRRRWCWWAAPRTTSAPGPWTASAPRSAPRRPTSKSPG